MLRLLRITGILFFAILIGFTANRIQELYEAGNLFEQYNSQRKADITLLMVSTLGLIVLGFFEFIRSRRRFERRGYVSEKEEEPVVNGLDSTSIYSTPQTVDKWEGRRTRTSKSRHRQSRDVVSLWIGLLRIYCVVFPVLYLYTLVSYLIYWLPSGAGNLVLTILFPILLLGSVLMAIGILRKKTWGMNFGYGMAIFHLLIFPVGTIAGLVLLVGLVGATSEFAIPDRERRRQAIRKAKRQNLKSAAI